jgi:hypothetical protein
MRSMIAGTRIAGAAFAAALALSSTGTAQEQNPTPLKPASEFDGIADQNARSVALFEEAGKVILHPRCVNCHPAGDTPTQGMELHVHQPPVIRGDADIGAPGMMCTTCHGADNFSVTAQAETIRSIPGNPAWHLAPIAMAWAGKSLGEICEQLKDPARNGNKSLDEIVDHMANDGLVGWGWDPGAGREPVPGTQQAFGELIKYWVETGAACPS